MKILKIITCCVKGYSINVDFTSGGCINHYEEQLIKNTFKDRKLIARKKLSCTEIHPCILTNNMQYNTVISYCNNIVVPESYTK